MVSRVFTTALLLLLICQVALCCYKGTYKSFIVYCVRCDPGFYCPGDDRYYPCKPGTIATGFGNSECTPCPNKRSDQKRTFCLLEDTPADSREIFNTTSFVVDVAHPYWFTTIVLKNHSDATDGYKFVQLTFADKKVDGTKFVVYASRKTGKPDANSHEFFATGANATIAINSIDYMDETNPLYINIVPTEQQTAQIVATPLGGLGDTITITEAVTVFNSTKAMGMWNTIMTRFLVKNAPSNSRMNFTLSIEGAASFNQNFLYFSDLKTIEYPNANNAKYQASSVEGSKSTTTLHAVTTEGGDIYVGLSAKTMFNARITVQVSFSKVMVFNA